MRGLSLLTVIIVSAVAACTDVAAPVATGPDAPSLMKVAHSAPTSHGGNHSDARGERGHDNDDRQACSDDDDGRGKGDHLDRHSSPWLDRWGKHGQPSYPLAKRGHNNPYQGKRRHNGGDESGGECGGGSGGDATATISGTVMNDGTAASSYPVYLLNGAAVVATTATTTDGTGSYAFVGIQPGTYLVCEDDPFLAAHGFLGETEPTAGPPCPSGYAPRGFSVTVAAGGTVGGNDFKNFTLE
jgi:hypothetical protein